MIMKIIIVLLLTLAISFLPSCEGDTIFIDVDNVGEPNDETEKEENDENPVGA